MVMTTSWPHVLHSQLTTCELPACLFPKDFHPSKKRSPIQWKYDFLISHLNRTIRKTWKNCSSAQIRGVVSQSFHEPYRWRAATKKDSHGDLFAKEWWDVFLLDGISTYMRVSANVACNAAEWDSFLPLLFITEKASFWCDLVTNALSTAAHFSC